MSRTTQFDRLPIYRAPKVKIDEALERIKREVKRRMIADGTLTDPSKARPRWDYHWGVLGREGGGVVQANTTAEARSKIKKALGLKPKDRLPSTIKLVRVDPYATQPSSNGEVEGSAVTA